MCNKNFHNGDLILNLECLTASNGSSRDEFLGDERAQLFWLGDEFVDQALQITVPEPCAWRRHLGKPRVMAGPDHHPFLAMVSDGSRSGPGRVSPPAWRVHLGLYLY